MGYLVSWVGGRKFALKSKQTCYTGCFANIVKPKRVLVSDSDDGNDYHRIQFNYLKYLLAYTFT